MGLIRNATITFFAMWVGMGFLVGLTGNVISAPKYRLPVDTTPPLVYNSGLEPQGQAVAQVAAGGGSQGISINRPEDIFTTKACIQCHPISYYDIKGGETGPDLSFAYTDVQDRFGRTLQDFLDKPEGTMGAIIPDRLDEDDKVLVFDLIFAAHEAMTSGNPINEESAINDTDEETERETTVEETAADDVSEIS